MPRKLSKNCAKWFKSYDRNNSLILYTLVSIINDFIPAVGRTNLRSWRAVGTASALSKQSLRCQIFILVILSLPSITLCTRYLPPLLLETCFSN